MYNTNDRRDINNIMEITTPNEVATSFLQKFQEYKNGVLTGPILSTEMTQDILACIRFYPSEAIVFFHRTGTLIIEGLKGSYDGYGVLEGLMEWNGVLNMFFIPIMNNMMSANARLMDELHPEYLYNDAGLPVPDADPSEVFKNIEGFDMNWITSIDDIPPEASDSSEDKPES
jgi:hypothetical protein